MVVIAAASETSSEAESSSEDGSDSRAQATHRAIIGACRYITSVDSTNTIADNGSGGTNHQDPVILACSGKSSCLTWEVLASWQGDV